MLLADLRYAVRTLRRSPVFTIATVLTMALTIGANTAIFSVVNAVLIRPLPFASPERLMQVAEKNDKLNISNFAASVLNYLSWKEQNQSFQGLAAIGSGTYTVTGRGDSEQINGATISPSLLPILGIQPVLGRGFREGEDLPGAAPVALISQALWRRRFAGEHAAIGAHITLNGVDHTVVGIASDGLPFLTTGDIWTPLIVDPGREIRLNHVIIPLLAGRGTSPNMAPAPRFAYRPDSRPARRVAYLARRLPHQRPPKANNISGLQVADLLAHRSFKAARARPAGGLRPANFGGEIAQILLDAKSDRNGSGTIDGWGIKWLP